MEFRLVISLEKDLEHPFWDEKINFISNESPSITLPKGLSSLLPEYSI
ncbi:MAG: hypothetical protein HGA25_07340 [Clostridiales bacterium]|nr:hypothetical protein [Clostridiales bacterium]